MVNLLLTVNIYVESGTLGSTITVAVAVSVAVDGVVRLIIGILYHRVTENVVADIVVSWLSSPRAVCQSNARCLNAVGSVGLFLALDLVVQFRWVYSSIAARTVVVPVENKSICVKSSCSNKLLYHNQEGTYFCLLLRG